MIVAHLSAVIRRVWNIRSIYSIVGLVAVLPISLCAQNPEPLPAPDDVSITLATEGDRHDFHLGELVPITYSYSSKSSAKYLWVSEYRTLAAGHGLTITCSPPAEAVRSSSDYRNANLFQQMLAADCGGMGTGGGIGGGCAHCQAIPLEPKPLEFGVTPLNGFVRFRTPGTYSCIASAADVANASDEAKDRHALMVTSNAITFMITDDPTWAHSAATAYAQQYRKLCRVDDTAEHRLPIECFDLARRITYLDSSESLATEVEEFDGRTTHGWDNGFQNAIWQSSHETEAVKLMTRRIQQPDFQVSTDVLLWLAAQQLKMDAPDAFQGGKPETYHSAAIETVRSLVRRTGESLAKKNPDVLVESVKTYRFFAEQQYCAGQTLIPEDERKLVLRGLRFQP